MRFSYYRRQGNYRNNVYENKCENLLREVQKAEAVQRIAREDEIRGNNKGLTGEGVF